MYFSYNGTRDWLKIRWRDQSCIKLEVGSLLKIKWRDQSCMKLEVVAYNKHSVTFWSSLLALDLRETGLFERVCRAQIHFLLFLRDASPAYEIPLNWSNLLGENLSKYKHGTLRSDLLP